jgi:C4-dicarboxylate-specific signal transduction histidine kinase
MRRLALVVALSWWVAGCQSQQLDEAALREKESALNKLAASLESAVRFQDAPESMSEEQLKAFAVKEDPAQLDPFRELLVRVRRQARYSSVLVCTADGSRALWEDAGCTPPLDLRLWDRNPPAACAFQLDLAQTCR